MHKIVFTNMDSINQMDDSYRFFLDGFYHGELPDDVDINLFEYFDFNDCNKEDTWYPPMCRAHLEQLHTWFADNVVGKVFDHYILKECNMWFGVDEPSSDWHNDNQGEFNSNILVYMDNDMRYNGNNIKVRNELEEHTIWPKRGDFVWLNQSKQFEHKATHKSGVRRVLSFEFLIPQLS